MNIVLELKYTFVYSAKNNICIKHADIVGIPTISARFEHFLYFVLLGKQDAVEFDL